MARYFFNVRDGQTTLDDIGMELPSLVAARQMAIATSGEILKNGAGPAMWAGMPWCMWITDAPGGGGKTLFTLSFSATDGDGTSP